VADYLDAINGASSLPVKDNAGRLLADNGVTLRLGLVAYSVGEGQVAITLDDVSEFQADPNSPVTDRTDPDFEYPTGIFDFEASGLGVGGSVRVVVPLLAAIPANATYRSFSGSTGWSPFRTSPADGFASAPGSLGVCPAAGDSAYVAGLNEGDFCVQLTLTDGGPNDADGQVNGQVFELGGVAVDFIAPPVVVADKLSLDTTPFSKGDGERVVLRFSLESDSTDAQLEAITLETSGSMHEVNDIGGVRLYYDANANGVPEASERIGDTAFSSDDDSVAFDLSEPLPLRVGSNDFLVTYRF